VEVVGDHHAPVSLGLRLPHQRRAEDQVLLGRSRAVLKDQPLAGETALHEVIRHRLGFGEPFVGALATGEDEHRAVALVEQLEHRAPALQTADEQR